MSRIPDVEVSIIRRLRQRYKPCEIAAMTGRTEGTIKWILWREKKNGADFPKLRHGNLKYDNAKAQEWRALVRKGLKYTEIKELMDVHPGVICRTLAMEGRGELKW